MLNQFKKPSSNKQPTRIQNINRFSNNHNSQYQQENITQRPIKSHTEKTRPRLATSDQRICSIFLINELARGGGPEPHFERPFIELFNASGINRRFIAPTVERSQSQTTVNMPVLHLHCVYVCVFLFRIVGVGLWVGLLNRIVVEYYYDSF